MKSLIARSSGLALAIAVGTAFLVAPSAGLAQQKFKYSFKSPEGISKYTAQHALDVGDVPGHQVRVASLHAKFGDVAPEYDGVKAVEEFTSISSDYINGSGRFVNYAVTHMANGDKVFGRIEGLSQTTIAADGARKTSYTFVSTLTGGTGKFATLRGTLRGSGSTDFKTGVTANPTEGEYWFEKPAGN